MADSVSAFVIRELTGDKRTFRFTNRALPYRPFTLSGDQRHDITWYAGSPEGTLQLLGAKENETTINGFWKDRFLRPVASMSPAEQVAAGFSLSGQDGSGASSAAGQQGSPGAQIEGESIANIRELAETIDDVRRKGQLVEVTWVNQLRRGIISSFRQSWHTAQDLEWEIRFVWTNQGSQLADVPVQTRSLDTSDSVVEIGNQLSTLQEVNDVSLGVGDGTGEGAAAALSTVNDKITQLQAGLVNLQDAVISNAQTLLSPLTTARRIMGLFDFMKGLAIETVNTLEQLLESSLLNTSGTFSFRVGQRRTLRAQSDAATRISRICAVRQAQLEKQVKPELIKAFIARADQDLRDVALDNYGRADDWIALLQFNNLSSSKLAAGQLVLVPRNPPTEGC